MYRNIYIMYLICCVFATSQYHCFDEFALPLYCKLKAIKGLTMTQSAFSCDDFSRIPPTNLLFLVKSARPGFLTTYFI